MSTTPSVPISSEPRLSDSSPRPLERARPAFARPASGRTVVRVASTMPEPTTVGSAEAVDRPAAVSACLTSSGVIPGFACSVVAATPETRAAAIEVPLPLRYGLVDVVGYTASSVLLGARSDVTCAPGATTSGFAMPADVGPREEKSGVWSSPRPTVPRSSTAPTVTTHGSSPGLAIVPGAGPVFAAATTTTMPAAQARSTA